MHEDKFRINKQREEIKRLRNINSALVKACEGLLYIGKGCESIEFINARKAIKISKTID